VRMPGVFLFPALLIGAIHRRHYRPRAMTPRMLGLLMIPAGLGVVMWMQKVQAGDPLAFLEYHAAWGRTPRMFLLVLRDAARDAGTYPMAWFEVFCAMLLFVVVAASTRLLDIAHTIFTLILVLASSSSGTLMSLGRVMITAVPMYVVLAMWTRNALVERFVAFVMTLFLALFACSFATWYWAG
jgi:hypothetical protein